MTISPSIEWVGGKNGANRKNGTESMFPAKRKNRNFSTNAVFKLLQKTARQTTRKPISFNHIYQPLHSGRI